MSEEIRTDRTHGLKERLPAGARGHLVQIRYMPGYDVILDLIEMCCIEQETRLINVPVEDEKTIIAEHKMSKAFWQVFQAIQKKVESEVNIQLQLDQERKAEQEDSDDYDPEQQMLRP